MNVITYVSAFLGSEITVNIKSELSLDNTLDRILIRLNKVR